MPTASAGCSAGPAELELPGGADEHDHADVHAVLSYTCRSPGELKNIRVNLFDAFPKLHKLKVQLAAPGRQAAFELSSALRDIAW